MDLDLGDLGLGDPERPLPKASRGAVIDWSPEAVKARKIAAREARSAARNAEPAAEPVDEAASWVEAVRDYRPELDIEARQHAVEWAVEDWIQRGKVGALVAGGGTGKTTILMMLGICIALGWPFFGQRVQRGSFLLLSADDDQHDLDAVLALLCRALKLSPEDFAIVAVKLRLVSIIGLAGTRTFTTTVRGDILATDLPEVMHTATEGMTDLVGVALDTLRQFCGGSSNEEQVIKLTLDGCRAFAQRRQCFVVLSHHTGKQSYRDSITDMYCGSGSAAIADNSRFVLLLQAAEWSEVGDKIERTGNEAGQPLVLRSTRGSIMVKEPPPMYLCRDGFRITRIKGRTLSSAEQVDARDRKVLQAVRAGHQSKRAVFAEVGGNKRQVFDQVDALVGRGLLVEEPGTKGGTKKLMVAAPGARLLDTPKEVGPKGGTSLSIGPMVPPLPD